MIRCAGEISQCTILVQDNRYGLGEIIYNFIDMVLEKHYCTDLACEKGYSVHTLFWNSIRLYTHDSEEPL